MAKSARIGMPFLSPGQAQKEISHNEALILLDFLIHGCCAGAPSNAPPQLREVGLTYLCGPLPTGEWSGHPNSIACWGDSGWRFIDPVEGFGLLDRFSEQYWRFRSGQWFQGLMNVTELRVNGVKVVGAKQPAISAPAGGNVIDTEARNVLHQLLTAMRSHGLIAQNE